MEQVKVLENKINLVVLKVEQLERDKKKVEKELELLKIENIRYKQLAENSFKYTDEKKTAIQKVEKIIKKLNGMIIKQNEQSIS